MQSGGRFRMSNQTAQRRRGPPWQPFQQKNLAKGWLFLLRVAFEKAPRPRSRVLGSELRSWSKGNPQLLNVLSLKLQLCNLIVVKSISRQQKIQGLAGRAKRHPVF